MHSPATIVPVPVSTGMLVSPALRAPLSWYCAAVAGVLVPGCWIVTLSPTTGTTPPVHVEPTLLGPLVAEVMLAMGQAIRRRG